MEISEFLCRKIKSLKEDTEKLLATNGGMVTYRSLKCNAENYLKEIPLNTMRILVS